MKNSAAFEMQQQIPFEEQLTLLLSQCSEGDEAALAELYQLTSANLFATHVRILGMNFMAELALHDTYLRIWMKSAEYSDELGAPMPWLTSIARNHALNLKRARRAAKEAATNMDDTMEIESEYIDTTFLARNPAAKPLKRYLDRLDMNTRDGIIRAYLDGWSLEELSELYNQPAESLGEAMRAAMLSMDGQV